jgi:hypothetical protein
MMIDKNQQASAQISPIQLIGSPTIYTYVPNEQPVIIGKRSIHFQNVITINIEELKMVTKDNKPGILINQHSDRPIHVTMDDTSLFTKRSVCIEVAKGINTNLWMELQEIRDTKAKEAKILLAEVAEYESAVKMIEGTINLMKLDLL